MRNVDDRAIEREFRTIFRIAPVVWNSTLIALGRDSGFRETDCTDLQDDPRERLAIRIFGYFDRTPVVTFVTSVSSREIPNFIDANAFILNSSIRKPEGFAMAANGNVGR